MSLSSIAPAIPTAPLASSSVANTAPIPRSGQGHGHHRRAENSPQNATAQTATQTPPPGTRGALLNTVI